MISFPLQIGDGDLEAVGWTLDFVKIMLVLRISDFLLEEGSASWCWNIALHKAFIADDLW
jgi:hypothetical protein